MIEIYALAEKLYKDSVFLKGQKSTSLTWKKNREKWLSILSEMRESVRKMTDIIDYSYSDEYFELLEEMELIIDACENGLRRKSGFYKSQSSNYMHAFHNLPRAFLAPENRMRITVSQAREYADFWLRHSKR